MKDLKNLTEEIMLREKKIGVEEEKELEILLHLGKTVYSADAMNHQKEETVDKIHSLVSEIEELNETLSDLREVEKRQKVIAEEKKSLNVEIKNLKGRKLASFENLARTSWDVWKSDKEKFSDLQEPLEDLIKAENRLNSVEDAMEQNTNNVIRKNIFKKSLTAILSGRRKTELIIQERLWNRAGKKVLEMVDCSILSGTPVEKLYTELKDLENNREELKRRVKDLEEECTMMEKPLGNFSVPGSFLLKITTTQKTLSGKEERLNTLYQKFGRTCVGKDVEISLPPEAESYKKEWDVLQETIQKLEEEKITLKAHQAYLRRQAELKRQVERVDTLEAQIKEKEDVLKEMKGILSSMEDELNRMEAELPEWLEG